MNTYEVLIGVFIDQLTTGDCERRKVKADCLFSAAHKAEEIRFELQSVDNRRREIIHVKRIL